MLWKANIRSKSASTHAFNLHVAAVLILTWQVYSHIYFTHIIQLWHDGTAAPHFKLDQVEYLLRVAQWLQDVHVASGVQLLLWQTDVWTWRDVPHQNDVSPGCSGGGGGGGGGRTKGPLPAVTTRDASDLLASHGLSAQRPMSDQSVWCDAPPKRAVSGARPLIGQLIQKGNHTCSIEMT